MGELLGLMFMLFGMCFFGALGISYEKCDREVPLNLHNHAKLLCEPNNGVKLLSVTGSTVTIECQNGLYKKINKDELNEED